MGPTINFSTTFQTNKTSPATPKSYTIFIPIAKAIMEWNHRIIRISTSSALLTFAFTLCVSRVETEEVLLSSPWLRKSGVGEGAEWKEDESRRGLFDPCVGR